MDFLFVFSLLLALPLSLLSAGMVVYSSVVKPITSLIDLISTIFGGGEE